MSLSIPITLKPFSRKKLAHSLPINPVDPVIIITDIISTFSKNRSFSKLAYREADLIGFLIRQVGMRSVVLIRALLNQFRGATTILCGLRFNQAAHQLKELFAMILCLHKLIK